MKAIFLRTREGRQARVTRRSSLPAARDGRCSDARSRGQATRCLTLRKRREHRSRKAHDAPDEGVLEEARIEERMDEEDKEGTGETEAEHRPHAMDTVEELRRPEEERDIEREADD